MTEPTTLLGAIVDTNSGGGFDLIVYEDGILAVKGTYVGVALRAGGARSAGGWRPLCGRVAPAWWAAGALACQVVRQRAQGRQGAPWRAEGSNRSEFRSCWRCHALMCSLAIRRITSFPSRKSLVWF